MNLKILCAKEHESTSHGLKEILMNAISFNVPIPGEMHLPTNMTQAAAEYLQVMKILKQEESCRGISSHCSYFSL
ncbi:hypothetical protein CEXT_346991 [Caerostris extrusa]|uniref:Uncharacterized protein n=1 Tax=Caerostris extrusa TaxID=172846 RepID=A0AAV4QQ56_CAEEX|nr:hypothetical protein CEXT_346991 [Caerostris extrusa]